MSSVVKLAFRVANEMRMSSTSSGGIIILSLPVARARLERPAEADQDGRIGNDVVGRITCSQLVLIDIDHPT